MSFSDYNRGRTSKSASRAPPRDFTGFDPIADENPKANHGASARMSPLRPGTSVTSPPILSPSGVTNELTYSELNEKISQLVYKITSNIGAMDKLVGFLGTARDTQETRDHLHEVTEQTRDMVKRTTEHIKGLTVLVNEPGADNRQRKLEQQKLSRDFQRVLEQFQIAQRRSIERTRQCVAVSKANHLRNDQWNDDSDNAEEQPLMQPEQRLQLQVLENEVDYNEAVIEEREAEITNISQGITELNGIFTDLARIVGQQGSMIDNIEVNVSNIGAHVRNAADELTTASRYQKRSRKWLCTILLILAGLLAIIVIVLVIPR